MERKYLDKPQFIYYAASGSNIEKRAWDTLLDASPKMIGGGGD